MKKQIYILITCDNWHSKDSYEIVGVYKKIEKAQKIAIKIAKQNMSKAEYNDEKQQLLDLHTTKQTQGLNTNFIIQAWDLL